MKHLLLILLVITILGEIVILIGLNIVDKDLHTPAPVQGVELKPAVEKQDMNL